MSSPTHERRRHQQIGHQVRALVAVVLVVTAITAALLTRDQTLVSDPAAVWLFSGLMIALAALVVMLPWSRIRPAHTGWAGLTAVALMAALIFATGGVRSPLYLFVPAVPVVSAVLYKRRWMQLVTVAAIAAVLLPLASPGSWPVGRAHVLQALVIALLSSLAALLVGELRRLYRDQRYLLAAAEIARLETGTDIDAFLHSALRRMLKATGLAFGAVARARADGAFFWAAAIENRQRGVVSAAELAGTPVSPEDWFVGHTVRTGELQISSDLFGDPRFSARPLPGLHPERSPRAGALATPLQIRQRILGVLYLVEDRPEAFQRQHVALTQLLSGHLATALYSREVLSQASREARLDPVTGAYNRRHLHECLSDLTAQAREHGLPLSLIFCDIRYFKQFNDRYGHLTGDWVLRGLTETLKRAARAEDIVTRYGGDEFVIVLPATDSTTAEAMRQHIDRHVAAWNDTHLGRELPARVHITLGVFTAVGPDAEELLHAADMAMFEARTTGPR